jgi:hypothetical protein
MLNNIKEILKHESIHKQQDELRRDKIMIKTMKYSPEGGGKKVLRLF